MYPSTIDVALEERERDTTAVMRVFGNERYQQVAQAIREGFEELNATLEHHGFEGELSSVDDLEEWGL